MEMGTATGRRTLSLIQYYPKPYEIWDKLTHAPGWSYKTNQDFYHTRDRALFPLLYLGDFRISEVLPIIGKQFTDGDKFILLSGVKVGKRKEGKIQYREARLPLEGERSKLTELVMAHLNQLEKPEDRLFPWSLEKKKVQIRGSFYKLKDGTIKPRYSYQTAGASRAWKILHALVPEWTLHWARAFGYNFDYDHMAHDILAVSDKTKADPRSLQPYLRRRYEMYPVR